MMPATRPAWSTRSARRWIDEAGRRRKINGLSEEVSFSLAGSSRTAVTPSHLGTRNVPGGLMRLANMPATTAEARASGRNGRPRCSALCQGFGTGATSPNRISGMKMTISMTWVASE
jgi:hypothetical protein